MSVVLETRLRGAVSLNILEIKTQYFIFETYSEPGDELIWKNEWGGEIWFFFY